MGINMPGKRPGRSGFSVYTRRCSVCNCFFNTPFRNATKCLYHIDDKSPIKRMLILFYAANPKLNNGANSMEKLKVVQ